MPWREETLFAINHNLIKGMTPLYLCCILLARIKSQVLPTLKRKRLYTRGNELGNSWLMDPSSVLNNSSIGPVHSVLSFLGSLSLFLLPLRTLWLYWIHLDNLGLWSYFKASQLATIIPCASLSFPLPSNPSTGSGDQDLDIIGELLVLFFCLLQLVIFWWVGSNICN